MVRHVCDCRAGYKTAYLLLHCVQTYIWTFGKLFILTSLSRINYLRLVLSFEVRRIQGMSKTSRVNNDTENIYGLFLSLKVFPTKTHLLPISIIMNEDINIINCVTKSGKTPSWKLEEYCWKRRVTVQGRYRGAASMQHFVLASK
jgi:hypothetical protein